MKFLLFDVYLYIGDKTVLKSRGGRKTRRIMMTDELREELTQAATATSQAYAVGSRNLSLASSTTAARGMSILIFHYIKLIKINVYL